jgi:hypothetical protein
MKIRYDHVGTESVDFDMFNCLVASFVAGDFHACDSECSCKGLGHTWIIFNVQHLYRSAAMA